MLDDGVDQVDGETSIGKEALRLEEDRELKAPVYLFREPYNTHMFIKAGCIVGGREPKIQGLVGANRSERKYPEPILVILLYISILIAKSDALIHR